MISLVMSYAHGQPIYRFTVFGFDLFMWRATLGEAQKDLAHYESWKVEELEGEEKVKFEKAFENAMNLYELEG